MPCGAAYPQTLIDAPANSHTPVRTPSTRHAAAVSAEVAKLGVLSASLRAAPSGYGLLRAALS